MWVNIEWGAPYHNSTISWHTTDQYYLQADKHIWQQRCDSKACTLLPLFPLGTFCVWEREWDRLGVRGVFSRNKLVNFRHLAFTWVHFKLEGINKQGWRTHTLFARGNLGGCEEDNLWLKTCKIIRIIKMKMKIIKANRRRQTLKQTNTYKSTGCHCWNLHLTSRVQYCLMQMSTVCLSFTAQTSNTQKLTMIQKKNPLYLKLKIASNRLLSPHTKPLTHLTW